MTVDEFGITGSLTLSKVLDGSKHISCNGLNVFNLLHDDNSLRVGVLDSLMVDSLLGSVQQPLLAKAKAVGCRSTLNDGVRVPIVFTNALLSRVVIAVSALVHLSVISVFLLSTTSWIENFLGVNNILGRQAISCLTRLCVLGPQVVTSVALAKGFSLD